MINKDSAIDGLRKAAEELARYAPMKVNGRCQMYFDVAIHALNERETVFLKDGHHVRCMHCGEYWCDTDSEGNLFPQNYCPKCRRKAK